MPNLLQALKTGAKRISLPRRKKGLDTLAKQHKEIPVGIPFRNGCLQRLSGLRAGGNQHPGGCTFDIVPAARGNLVPQFRQALPHHGAAAAFCQPAVLPHFVNLASHGRQYIACRLMFVKVTRQPASIMIADGHLLAPRRQPPRLDQVVHKGRRRPYLRQLNSPILVFVAHHRRVVAVQNHQAFRTGGADRLTRLCLLYTSDAADE